MSYRMVTTTCFLVTCGVKVGLGYVPLFTPRLCDFVLVQAIHSFPTLPMSCYKHDECFCIVEIWIHHVYPSPHTSFWVVGGDNYGRRPLRFTPRWSIFWLIWTFHSISTLPICHYKYNEWSEKVKIDIWAIEWSPQLVFSHVWGQSWLGLCSAFHTKIASPASAFQKKSLFHII